MRWFLVLVTVLLVHSWAFGNTDGERELTGNVISFDQKTLTVESMGFRYRVPRRLYPKPVKWGQEVYIPITNADFAKLPKPSRAPKQK